jgi:hypothetical protein
LEIGSSLEISGNSAAGIVYPTDEGQAPLVRA